MEEKEELKEQLEIVRKSKFFLLFFIAALFLSYYVTSIQEKQVICAILEQDCTTLPDPCPAQLAAGLLSFRALVFFYTAAGDTASFLSLLAGALRLFPLFDSCLTKADHSI